MAAHVDAGFTTWDLADHYGPAEDFVGEFRRRYAAERGAAALTISSPSPSGCLARARCPRGVGRGRDATSRRRMATEKPRPPSVPLVGLRRPALPRCARAPCRPARRRRHPARCADQFRHRAAGGHPRSRHPDRVQPGPVLADRPSARGAHGALLSPRTAFTCWPTGRCAADCCPSGTWVGPSRGPSALDTVSLQKYKHMMDAWGGWALFQELLAVLRDVAGRHGVSIATVSVRWVLDRPAVAGAILGRAAGPDRSSRGERGRLRVQARRRGSCAHRDGAGEVARSPQRDRRLRRRVPMNASAGFFQPT